jgi:NADH:ubiquinone oxidoreductase subunit F (NADH-binding)
MDILAKIKQAGLVGRGGACFPVEKKWAMAKDASGDKKYVVGNAAEGEPGVAKDGYILEHHAEKVIDGLKIAINFLSAEKGYLFLNHSYYKKFNKKLAVLIKDSPLEIFVKPINAGYIGGEESAVLNAIEGRRIEPRLKPPFPAVRGLWGCPTLINNVETFYNVSLVGAGKYANKRFYTITGDCLNEGVYELPDNLTIEKVLNQTKNYPKFSFFVQAGGTASGEALNSSQLKRQASGAGSIAVYSLGKNNFKKVIKGWLNFFVNESCGQCAPCREGTYRLNEIFTKEKIDWALLNSLLDNLSDTSFCALGGSVPVPIKSFIKNVYPQIYKSATNIQIFNK